MIGQLKIFKLKPQSGFSLFEIVVVISLISVLSYFISLSPFFINKEKNVTSLEEKIEIYPFSSHLPNLLSKMKESFDPEKILSSINIKKNERYIFYPAQFWAHKILR